MLTTPALLRLLLTTAAQSRDCARPGLGRFDRSHIVEVGAGARTRLRFSPPKVPRENPAARSAHGAPHKSSGIRSDSSFPSGCGISSHLEKNPCFRAFLATVLFPISVRGPVDFEAFRRLASICLDEPGGFLSTPAVVAVGLWVFWLAIPFS